MLAQDIGVSFPLYLNILAAIVTLDFFSSYIYHLTLGGFALTFPLESMETQVTKYQPNSDSGCDGTKINLKATVYR